MNSKPYKRNEKSIEGSKIKLPQNSNAYKRITSGSRKREFNRSSSLYDALTTQWETKKVIPIHRTAFQTFVKILTSTKGQEAIRREIETVNSGTNPVLALMKAIKIRENCISQLKKHIERMNEVFSNLTDSKEGIGELIETVIFP